MKALRKITALLLIAATLTICLGGCKKNKEKADPLAKYTEDTSTESKRFYYVAMAVEDYGIIIVELDSEAAPITVANFLELVRSGFYNGLTFHRVMNNFMIQGGDPKANGTGSSSKKIKGEFISNGYYNPIFHERGVISMARATDPNSASCQFFICNSSSASVSNLDGDYAAFGHVVEGIEVVDAITSGTARYGNSNGLISDKSKQAVITKMMVIEYTKAE